MRENAEQIFLAGVKRVLPDTLMRSYLKFDGRELIIAGEKKSLPRSLYLLAAGKASALMARTAEEILGDLITDGLVVTKHGYGLPLERLSLIEAGHPLPDEAGLEATHRMLTLARQAEEEDLVICLISGGASALMADLPEGATLEMLQQANDLLVRCGADITEINTVRKHLSLVKGGQLARAAAPATLVSLILSDVIGDRIDVIASGPTAPDNSTYADVMAVLSKYALEDNFPAVLQNHLRMGLMSLVTETLKPGDPVFQKVQNHVIGSNRLALEAAALKAGELGFEAHIINDALQGDYRDVADEILFTIHNHAFGDQSPAQCLLFGGEPTLKVRGSGLGGRNQHLALYLATLIAGDEEISILCAGTDGTDGPTVAAGAVVDGHTLSDAQEKKVNGHEYLSRYDSYHFFQEAGGHILTGNTHTNVMDMMVVLITSPSPCS